MTEMIDVNSLFIDGKMLLGGLIIASLLMIATWFAAKKLNNAGIVDIIWSASFFVVTSFYAIAGSGDIFHRLAILFLVFCWSSRLAVHLYQRVQAMLPREDGRYAHLRKEWGNKAQRNLFLFFQIQALSVAVLSAPMIVICASSTPEIKVPEMVGAVLWLFGVVGETIADKQLSDFVKMPENKGKTMKSGLWNYSRHPNYFFEWLVWLGYFLCAVSTSNGIITVVVPVAMLHFLLNVTGVKLAEEGSLRARGDEYRQYQKTTSPFVPWFKRKQSAG
jgi:steroid 5-alpha reductase family enzyme